MEEPTDTTKKEGENHNPLSRRKFLTNTALTVGAISIVPRHVLGRGFIAPNDKINLGFIGLGKQTNGLAKQFVTNTSAQIVAGCDVWTTKTAAFQKHVGELYSVERKRNDYKGITSYADYNELLSRKDIDAVVIATPDHWHAIQAMDAMHAGKDVYCEKPLTHRITEGMELVQTTKKTGKILQTGSMQRSWDDFRRACELVRNGYLGKITKILVNVGDPAVPYNMKEEPIPEELDWNGWCGPAPLLPYNHRLAPSRNDVDFWPDFRLFREVGGGILCDWGAHMFDIAQWALGMDHSGPVRYIPPSDKSLVRGLRMFYANGVEMVHEDFGRGWGVRFIGSEGTMDISRSYFETNPEHIKTAMPKDSDIRLYNSNGNHYQDWLDAIKNRTQPICDVETGHRSASICNIANIAYQLGRTLEWDPENEQFKGDVEANALRSRVNREYAK
ncbi:Gfo/Idh/MocA family oxidoreductase [Maribacter polysiphoniae]|uniref:Gfo/Idh/MocA family oxidoreductase n=1 Tax=Maribacter polysiphoniae TaxID=429344 RepID=A0A316DTQ6_9FLAO|nr:Gfo/Idh/MocA family oxidoreductase [Maribacter polysiphoniae]MBD1262521.1 Gfo/Idh/MocA family oxidoreductase [Maribacter polysiphoniae]PWK21355.1 putative dehydrogenase [Maribacter polysiphoniae]